MPVNILYSCIGGTSGYAEAAKNYVLTLAETCNVCYLDDLPDCAAGFPDEGRLWKRLEQLRTPLDHYDVLIMHYMPDAWNNCYEKHKHYRFKKVIGITVWETDWLNPKWVDYCNYSWLDEVWVPVEWNKTTFIKSGVKTDIRIVPHIYMDEGSSVFDEGDAREVMLSSIAANNFVYYTIGQWNERKGITETIQAFCNTYTSADKVCLVVKTFCEDYSAYDGAKCRFMLHNLLKKFSKPPRVALITDNFPRKYMELMHRSFNCFLSLCKSEGWGLGAFEAAAHGNKVIITGYGGQLEFLPAEYCSFISHRNEKVKNMDHLYWLRGQYWASPDIDDAVSKIKKMRLADKKKNAGLSKHIRMNFGQDAITKVMNKSFENI